MIISIKPYEIDRHTVKVVSRRLSEDNSALVALMEKLSRPENWRLGGYEADQYQKSTKSIWNQ